MVRAYADMPDKARGGCEEILTLANKGEKGSYKC